MKYTFRGGFHVEEHKNTTACALMPLRAPQKVFLPMQMHIGAPCTPCVKVGDRVLRGEKLGDCEGLGVPVHSSVSGTVSAIDTYRDARGAQISRVIIENDGLDETVTMPPLVPEDTSVDEMIGRIREAGIAGLGGATFPTHVKLRGAIGKVDTMIVNAAECEPYITANHRLLLEHTEEVVAGVRILARILGLQTAHIAIEDNKEDAAARLRECLAGTQDVSVDTVKTKYPQGDERQLIYALTRREIPAGGLPSDVACVIFNAETVYAVYRAIVLGLPLYERIVTVDGDCVAVPGNFLVPLGTPMRTLIEAAGGLSDAPARLISGGPMMGAAQWDPNAPVIKGTSALLVLSAEVGAVTGMAQCIRCGRCVARCPMRLMPSYLAAYARQGLYDKAEELGVRSCVECGTCSYVCPARVPIVQYIRAAKFKLNARAKRAGK